MVHYFISRHPGAVAWARNSGVHAVYVQHLEPGLIEPGDVVLGTLPVHKACEVIESGGRYFHLQFDIPEGSRGQELSASDLSRLGARLVEYRISRCEGDIDTTVY